MSSRTADLAADPRVARGMEAQLARRRERLAAGERPLGWKVGFGTPAAMEKLGTRAPLVGFLMEPALVDPGASVSMGGWANPVLEPEVAVHMGRDLPDRSDAGAAEAAIAALGPAFELADLDPPPDDVERILAGNIFQRAVMLGPRDERRTLDGVTARVARAGAEPDAVDDPTAQTGAIPDLLRHVADLLSAFGERLRAGEVVIAGSIVPGMLVAPGDAVDYRLDPLGELSIRFGA